MNNWKEIDGNGKVWIYAAKRRMTGEERNFILSSLDNFCADWAAHGEKLKCGFTLIRDQFILIGVDEDKVVASGCSIDTSVGLIREFDFRFELDLFNRLRVYRLKGDDVESWDLQEARTKMENGDLVADDLVANTTARTKSESDSFFIPLKDSWFKKYLINEEKRLIG